MKSVFSQLEFAGANGNRWARYDAKKPSTMKPERKVFQHPTFYYAPFHVGYANSQILLTKLEPKGLQHSIFCYS